VYNHVERRGTLKSKLLKLTCCTEHVNFKLRVTVHAEETLTTPWYRNSSSQNRF
jgi:hypothetical protein